MEYDPYDIFGNGIWQDAEKLARDRYGQQPREIFLANAKRILRQMKREAKTPAEKKFVKNKETLLQRLEKKRLANERASLTPEEVNEMGRQIREASRRNRFLTPEEVNRLADEIRSRVHQKKPKKITYDSDIDDEELMRLVDEKLEPNIYDEMEEALNLPRYIPKRKPKGSQRQQDSEEEDIFYDTRPLSEEVSIPQGEIPQGVIDEGVPIAPPTEAPDELTNNEYDNQNARLRRKLDFCELNKKLNSCLSGNISYLQPNISIGSVGSYRDNPYQQSQQRVPVAPSIDLPLEVAPPERKQLSETKQLSAEELADIENLNERLAAELKVRVTNPGLRSSTARVLGRKPKKSKTGYTGKKYDPVIPLDRKGNPIIQNGGFLNYFLENY
jgi:hypothetical protein